MNALYTAVQIQKLILLLETSVRVESQFYLIVKGLLSEFFLLISFETNNFKNGWDSDVSTV